MANRLPGALRDEQRRQVHTAPDRNPARIFWNGRLFSIGMTGAVTAFDAASGKQVWQKPSMMPGFRCNLRHAFSPVIEGNTGHLPRRRTQQGRAHGVRREHRGRCDGNRRGRAGLRLADRRRLSAACDSWLPSRRESWSASTPATGALLWEQALVSPNFTNSITPVRARKHGRRLGTRWADDGRSPSGGTATNGPPRRQRGRTRIIPVPLEQQPCSIGDALFGLTSRNMGQYFSRRCEDRQDALVVGAVARRRQRGDASGPARPGVQPRE